MRTPSSEGGHTETPGLVGKRLDWSLVQASVFWVTCSFRGHVSQLNLVLTSALCDPSALVVMVTM